MVSDKEYHYRKFSHSKFGQMQISLANGFSYCIQDKHKEEMYVFIGVITGIWIKLKDMLGVQMENTRSHAK